MPFIAEEPIDRIELIVDDLRDAVQAHTQAILMLNDRMTVASELLSKVHEAVTKPADGDGLGDMLHRLVEADERQTALLQQILAAVRKP